MMTPKPSPLTTVATALAVLVAACGGNDGPAAGGERGPCFPNGTCDDGLSCLSNFCVRVVEDGGSPDLGGLGPSPDGGGSPDAGVDVGPHPRQPQVADLGGPVLTAPKVQPIVYASDANAADITAFLAELAGGSYWRATTAEYGVGALTVLPTITLTSPAPAQITDTAIQSSIVANTSGSTPAWGPADASVIYLVVLPQGTTGTVSGAGSCCSDFGGYHYETTSGSLTIPYAVGCTCSGFLGPGYSTLEERTGAISHELIEAATDPFPYSDPALQGADQGDIVWSIMTGGGEVGDMCAFLPDAFYTPAGMSYVVQRSWSNAAASAGQDPCVPRAVSAPYFNTFPVLGEVTYGGSSGYPTRGIQIPLGGSRTIELDLFSAGPSARNWNVSLYSYEDLITGGTSSLGFSLDRSSGGNGDKLHLTITALSANTQLEGEPFVILSEYGTPSGGDYQTGMSMGLVTN